MMNDELLLNSLKKFYSCKNNSDKIISILLNDRNISLRSIDWFITNYSKKNKIYYNIYEKDNKLLTLDENYKHISNINVFQSYKSQLKAYSKKKFDPFCRRNRINFNCNGTIIDTTIGQLNFFRWAINNLILDYIFMNKNKIEKDMNTSLKNIKKKNFHKKGNRKIRQELSLSATRGLSRTNIYIKLDFD